MSRTRESSVGSRCGLFAAAAGLAFSVSGCAAAIVCCAIPAIAAGAVVLADSSNSSPAQAADATATIEVPEVECAACDLEVRKAIKGAGGVRRLNEGNPKSRIIVTYQPDAGRPEAYVEALHKAGFPTARTVR